MSRSPDGSPSSKGQRRCDDLTRRECSLLKPGSVFLRRWTCDKLGQRCILGVLPSTPTPIGNADEDRDADADRTTWLLSGGQCPYRGSCDLRQRCQRRRVASMRRRAPRSFCANCECSSHSVTGFSFDVGICVTRTPTPTVTATPAERRGCCQLTGLRGANGAVCGNDVRESTCSARVRCRRGVLRGVCLQLAFERRASTSHRVCASRPRRLAARGRARRRARAASRTTGSRSCGRAALDAPVPASRRCPSPLSIGAALSGGERAFEIAAGVQKSSRTVHQCSEVRTGAPTAWRPRFVSRRRCQA